MAFAPLYLFIIFFFTLKYLLDKTLEESSQKTTFWVGWFFGFGYFIGNCYWYCNSLLLEPLRYGWLIPFAVSIIPAYLACYTGLTTFCTKYVTDKLKIDNKFIITIIFSLLWVSFEYIRGVALTGFPWNLICYCLAFSPLLIQTVSLTNCYIFSFFILTIFTSFFVLLDKKYKLYVVYYTLLMLFIVVFGFLRLKNSVIKYSQYKVRLVQPNISLNDRITMEDGEILDILIDKTKENIEDVEYVFWHEAALPYAIFDGADNKILEYISKELKNKVLITGGIRVEQNENGNWNNRIYNSVFVIQNGKVIDYYDKYNLVPFGEFIPFRRFLPFIEAIATNLDLYRSKERRKIINIDDKFPSFSPNICYESIFPSSVNKKAELIVNFTNDFWFGNSSGPYQHFDALKFRAVENNIPALRIANSGITAIIDNYGRVIRKTKLESDAVIDDFIPLK